MDIRAAAADRGVGWLFEGFGYFTKDPGTWLGLMIVLIVIVIASHFVPIIGSVALQILMPVFMGGLMLGCRAQDSGGQLVIGHLFEGFSTRSGQLALVGLLYFVGLCVIVLFAIILMMVFLGGVGALQQLQQSDPAAVVGVLASLALPFLVALALTVPLLMFVWFAPPLIVFDGKDAIEAMGLSFRGCLLNVVPFLLYGIVGLVLAMLATIPFMLGWLILGPMVTASIYISYKEIFGGAAALTPAAT
jgi:uncharacterized membrane protein